VLAQKKMGKVWSQNSESTTRTIIDMILLDALSECQIDIGQKLACWGEVSLRWKEPGQAVGLNGSSDYVFGYGTCDTQTEQLLLVGEAKALGEQLLTWQLVAYLGIIHRARKQAARQNSTVYGFLTDSRLWQFFRIDNDSKVWASTIFDRQAAAKDIWSWLVYMVDSARRSTPSSSPLSSTFDIAIELSNFCVLGERFTFVSVPDHGSDVNDDVDVL
jgi:hypothetical protein